VAERRADPRYRRLMEATRLAAREGYDAVSMRDLADKCRLSMTTIYQFCRPFTTEMVEPGTANPQRGMSRQGTAVSTRTSPGRPSTRSPRMLRMICDVPPSMVLARDRRKRPLTLIGWRELRVIG
jgi:hypothetical protein